MSATGIQGWDGARGQERGVGGGVGRGGCEVGGVVG